MMTPEQFCYWLQGRAELQPDSIPTPEEWRMIREHLQTVFVKVTPPLDWKIDTTPRSPTSSPPDWMRWQTYCVSNPPSGPAIATC